MLIGRESERLLVGRRPERRLIERLVTAGRLAESGVLVLTGEAGIGKSALLDHAASLASGMHVLRAEGSESEHEVAFAGLSQLLRPALALLDRIPPLQADALAVALALRSGSGGDRMAVGAATLSLLSRFAEEQPLAVLVDDAHLMDRPSVDAIVFTARRLMADPIVLLIATRPDPSVLSEAGLPELHLEGVDAAAAGELVARFGAGGVASDAAAWLHRATGGNPLAIIELARDPQRLAGLSPETPIPVPDTLTRIFMRRCRRLDPRARTALLLAAVAGGDPGVTSRACQVHDIPVSALIAAEQLDLIRIGPGRIEFRHPLVRSAVYGGASAADRRSAHEAIAAALPSTDLERRAWHLSESAMEPDEPIAAALAEVGGRAGDRCAHSVAATAFERAARLTPDPGVQADRLAAAGQAAWLAGLGDRAGALLAEALACGPGPSSAARVHELRAAILARRGSPAGARDILLAAAEEVSAADPDQAIVLLADAINACFYLGAAESALAAAGRLAELLETATSRRATVLGTMARGMALVFAGQGGVEQIRTAVELLASSGRLLDDEPLRHAWLCLGPLFLRESGTGRELIEHAVNDLRDRAAVGSLPYLLFHVARDDATTDHWVRAEAEYDEGIRLARETDQPTELAMCLAGLAWLEARLGREDRCRGHAEEALRIGTAHGIHLGRAWALFGLGELDLALGRPDEALTRLEELASVLDDVGVQDVDLSPAPETVEALLRLDRAGAARAVAERYRQRAAAKGQPWALARAERVAGLLCPDADIDRHFGAALEHHRRTLEVYETARTALAYGSRLRRARRRADARPHLRGALATFTSLGAQPWAETAAAELKATGETAQHRGPDRCEELTPQEWQIAMMLAEGRTTRQAAAALFLSPKTVEYHLRHVYLKLGIGSRGELARTMSALR